MKTILLHLSDIHISNENSPILKHANDIAACTFLSLPDAVAVFILITGDIAFSGKVDQYNLASAFLSNIKTTIQNEKSIPVYYVIAPGNHDCDFDKNNKLREMAIKHLSSESNTAGEIDDSVIEQCCEVQKAFFEFRKELESDVKPAGDKLWETHIYEINGKTLVFDALNLSWVSKISEDLGGIVFPYERYINKENEPNDVRIALMHHPMNWMGAGYRNFRQFIRKLSSIILTGHEHRANIGMNIDSESMESVFIEGAVLQDNNSMDNSSFSLVTLDLDESTFKIDQFKWSHKRYESTEEGSWADYKRLPPKHRSEFEIVSEFKDKLNDPGANFRHAGRSSILLPDIYVYSDMMEIGKDRNPISFVSCKILQDPNKTKKGVLLAGEEKVGCSSLLFRLYDEYHERGFVPLYVNGANFRQNPTKDLDSMIKRAVHEQYGENAYEAFAQLSISKKLLLLDDFDDSPTKSSKEQASILSALKSRFGHLVATVGELFEVKEMLGVPECESLQEFSHFKLQPFGFSLRHRLIKRWMSIGNESVNESQIIAKIDQAEKVMDTVMSSNLIPSMPLYLITLLQSFEAGRTGEFKDSALGHYYDYLLTDGFLAANIPKDKIKEMYDYCTELAWHFHCLKRSELSRIDLEEFNKYFTVKFTTVDFNDRIDKLIRSKVLMHRGDEYFHFRYPYIYYFLKGRYLSKNLKEKDVANKQYVEKCSNHLYVRDNANTLLFLAHHSNDSFILDTVISSLKKLFSKFSPVAFARDTDKVAALISDAANLKLSYTEVPPEEFREKANSVRDAYKKEHGGDGLAEREEEGDALSLLAQIVTLFKTVEILGQILKNQYSNVERTNKEFILDEIFSGPLRALSSFYELITQNPDHLVNEIDTALKDRNKMDDELERRRIASQIAARLIQFISLGFIFKASSSVNADVLHEDIRSVVRKNQTPAYHLIEMGVLLDSSRPLPREELMILKVAVGKDVIALSVLQMLLIRRLYMFSTSYDDKQWLFSKLQLNLEFQHALDFKSSKTKLKRT
jgi:hypothetical protein